MRKLIFAVPLLTFVSATFAFDPPKPVKPIKPIFKMSRETTYITEPLDKDGYPDYETALNEKLRGTIKPENNACILLWKAIGPTPEGGKPLHADYWKWLGADCPTEKGDYFIDAFKYFKKTGRTEFGEADYDLHSRLSFAPWKAEDHRDYALWLEANETPLAIVVEAVKRKEYYSPHVARNDKGEKSMLFEGLLPHLQKYREICDALLKRAMLRIGQKKYDLAWTDLMTCNRMARHIGKKGSLIEMLVSYAIEQIAIRGDIAFLEFSRFDSNQFRKHFEEFDSLPALTRVGTNYGLTERFYLLDATARIHRDGTQVINDLIGVEKKQIKDEENRFLKNMNWSITFQVITRRFDREATILLEKDHAKRKSGLLKYEEESKRQRASFSLVMDDFQNQLLDGNVDDVFADRLGQYITFLLMPASFKVSVAEERCIQGVQNTRLAFALAAYHADTKKYPATLDALAPKYLAAIPNDLFSGKPLIYKPTETGYLLYSVGLNEKDDGGKFYSDEDRGDDIGVRMPGKKK